ncbi:MAG: hypothetical protein WA419_21485 [Silvibacterium sp.]
MAKHLHGNHIDQYPLALLLEDGYLGTTIERTPPTGAEEIREYWLATTLHMFTLPKGLNGVITYLGVKSSGSLEPEKERVFLRAKGVLYIDEHRQKMWDRLWSFVLGFGAGLLTTIGAAWLKRLLALS